MYTKYAIGFILSLRSAARRDVPSRSCSHSYLYKQLSTVIFPISIGFGRDKFWAWKIDHAESFSGKSPGWGGIAQADTVFQFHYCSYFYRTQRDGLFSGMNSGALQKISSLFILKSAKICGNSEILAPGQNEALLKRCELVGGGKNWMIVVSHE